MTAVLEVVIGLVFVYLILSLICSGIAEGIATVVSLRAKTLEQAIGRLLGPNGRKDLYQNELVKALAPNDRKKPSYIPSKIFSSAILSKWLPNLSPASTANEIKTAIDQITVDEVKKPLQSLWSGTEQTLQGVRTAVEDWYDSTMERVSGWYTRRAKLILVAVGFVVAIGLNVDSFVVGSSLWRDPTVRSATVNAAEAAASKDRDTGSVPKDCPTAITDPKESGKVGKVTTQVNCLQQLKLPVGWTSQVDDPRRFPHGWSDELARIIGWLVTALALALGAGFWFNALRGIIGLRATGPPPSSSPDKTTGGAGGPDKTTGGAG